MSEVNVLTHFNAFDLASRNGFVSTKRILVTSVPNGSMSGRFGGGVMWVGWEGKEEYDMGVGGN